MHRKTSAPQKRLALNRETIRTLGKGQLAQAAGGISRPQERNFTMYRCDDSRLFSDCQVCVSDICTSRLTC